MKYVITGSRAGVLGPFESGQEALDYIRLNQPHGEIWEYERLVWPYYRSPTSTGEEEKR